MRQDMEQYILTAFEHAIEAGYIQPYYQPVVRTMSRQLCGMEALARWVDPRYGVIQPTQFIPLLEERRLIHLLDACIVRQVCARLRRVSDAGMTPIPVSVNLSRLDFSLCDIFEVVDDIVTQYEIPHDVLHIEITEGAVASGETQMREVIDRFRAAGYQVWMDDFGSAYSSLNALKDFEFDELKLDMRFLSSMSWRARRIMISVIQMAKEIDIHTLAEGVETEEQFQFLRDIGCEKAQGYFFGKPMPYDALMAHIRDSGIAVESPQERRYYDEIGRINLLSAVPFMTRAERDALTTARQLNSIPLALVEVRVDSFAVLFYNSAFKQNAEATGMVPDTLTQERLRERRPFTLLPARVVRLFEAADSSELGRMHFISHDEYYEIQAKRVARTRDAYCLLLRMSNLSRASRAEKTSRLDEGLRPLYTLFERVTLVDTAADAITPMYVATREDVLSGRKHIRKLAQEFAQRWIFPDDREAYLAFMDTDTLEERLRQVGGSFVARYFRSYTGHGQYAWKRYTLLRLGENKYAGLIQNVHGDLTRLERKMGGIPQSTDSFAPAQLWKSLTQSDIVNLFWKDGNRRFLGASQGFLDYYGFRSLEAILGKNDEDLGWHVHPESYMNDELLVLREGRTTHNIPGRCICSGENRDILASKAPLYDANGEICGLIGCFVDRDLLNANDSRGQDIKRRDMLTGLLNSRGVSEEAHTFQDEYDLRGIDFVRIHVAIDNFAAVNREYGFDFGDKVIATLGKALKEAFGVSSAVGRFTGHQFVILHQVRSPEELKQVRQKMKRVTSGIRQVDGISLTLYLSVGYALYSEFENLEEMAQKAELRLLADHDERAPVANRQARASEIFHLYDDLPISFAVYRVTVDAKGVVDAKLFYVNRRFEEYAGMKAAQLLGVSTRSQFTTLSEDWYDMARRAALMGETIVDKMYYAPTGKCYYMTVSQVIRPGYCSFTYQEQEGMDAGAPAGE